MTHGTSAKPTRQNRTITVDFQETSTYLQLMDDGKAFVEFVFAFLLSLGFQLVHKATCTGGWVPDATLPLCSDSFGWAHHLAHTVHLVQGGLHGLAAFRPPLSLDATEVARDVLLATHGGLSLELCAVIGHISPMALYRLCLCVWPPELGGRADPLWLAVAGLYPGR